jgi:hypothetical protein
MLRNLPSGETFRGFFSDEKKHCHKKIEIGAIFSARRSDFIFQCRQPKRKPPRIKPVKPCPPTSYSLPRETKMENAATYIAQIFSLQLHV